MLDFVPKYYGIYVVERLLEYIISIMQVHTVDNEWRQQWSEWPFQLSELKFDSLLQLELVFVFAAICLQSKNHVQRPVKCATR